MKWKRNAKDGVSPVIAVILMVAITVVLAGVVVLWVTRLSKTEEEGPEMLTLDV
ncbi:type IV pilin, partial [Thermoplasmatales archaeon ex4484_36]